MAKKSPKKPSYLERSDQEIASSLIKLLLGDARWSLDRLPRGLVFLHERGFDMEDVFRTVPDRRSAVAYLVGYCASARVSLSQSELESIATPALDAWLVNQRRLVAGTALEAAFYPPEQRR